MAGWWLIEMRKTDANGAIERRLAFPVENTVFATTGIKEMIGLACGDNTALVDYNTGDTFKLTTNVKELVEFIEKGHEV